MAGLSGYPALDVDPVGIGARNFATTESGLNSLQQYQMGQTLMPDVIAAKQAELQAASQQAPIETQQKQTALGIQQADAQSRVMEVQNAQMANVARQAMAADPEQRSQIWDAGYKKLQEQGITQAGQYISQYRDDLAERVADIYGAPANSGGARNGKTFAQGGADPDAIARAVYQLPPDQLRTALRNNNLAVNSLANVHTAQDLQNEVTQLEQAGIPVSKIFPGIDFSRTDPASFAMNHAAMANAIDRLKPVRDALSDRAAQLGLGGPDITPKPMYEPQSQYVGVETGTGRPVYHDLHGGPDTTGSTPIAPKPSAGMATFMLKQQAYLASHPGDATGALEFANGKRNMSPSQMEEAALNQANKELGDATLSGATIPDPDSWVRQKAAQNYALISGASVPQSAPGGAPGPGGGPGGQPAPAAALPARAIDVLRKAGGQSVKFNNGQSWKMGPNGKPVRVS